ncbi:unnamed protein product, partial [Mesorhabditis spiculigera]
MDPADIKFPNIKPNIGPVGASGLLGRLQSFLPQMEEANKNLQPDNETDVIEIDAQDSDDDSSDSDSEGSSSDGESEQDEGSATEQKSKVVVDISLLREGNPSDCAELPKAWREDVVKAETTPTRRMVEEVPEVD